jgi:hypothetical protein
MHIRLKADVSTYFHARVQGLIRRICGLEKVVSLHGEKARGLCMEYFDDGDFEGGGTMFCVFFLGSNAV